MEKRTRCTEFELTKRISEVYKMLLVGKSRRDIIEDITSRYDVVAGTVDYYIGKARSEFQDVVSADIAEKKSIAQARYEDLYAKALDADDIKTAKSVLDSLSKLQGFMSEVKLVDVPTFEVKWTK